MLNHFKCVTSSSNVLGSDSTQEFLNKIQYGNNNYLHLIEEARDIYYKDAYRYTNIKRNCLPCYSLNFRFNKFRRNANIIDSTGYIYLDIDGTTDINFNHTLLNASWLSLSGKGRGALVKVKGLTPINFNNNYNLISKELGIESDAGARKSTQVNVLSYDPNLFINDNSDYWECKTNNEKIPHNSSNINTHTIVTTEMGEKILQDIRYDNLEEVLPKIEFDGDAIYDHKDKIHYCKVKLPFNAIEKSSRNMILSSIAYQIRALNPFIQSTVLLRIMVSINYKICIEPLSIHEIEMMVVSTMKIEQKDLKPVVNVSRRFVYNDIYDLTTKEKRSLTMTAINADKVKNSKLKIEKAIKEWDFIGEGKITQKSLTSATKMNKKTIEKYYPLYKSDIQLLNKKYYKKK